MTALGIDIYNGNSDGYDMHRVAADLGPGGFVIHKASQGWDKGPGGWIDWKLQGAIARARAAGIRRVGGYHWLLRGNGAAQADQFARALDLIGGRAHVGAFIDYERNDWQQALNPDRQTLADFLTRARQIGVNPEMRVYTAKWYTDGYANANVSGLGLAPIWWSGYINVGQVPIGQALAGVTPNWMAPFDGISSYAIRQFSSNVLVAGNPSDVNVSYLPDADLDRLFGITTGPHPVPTDQEPLMSVLVGLDLNRTVAQNAWNANKFDVLQLLLSQAGMWILPNEQLVDPKRTPEVRYENLRGALGGFQKITKTGNPDGSADLIVGPATAAALCEQKKRA